MSAPSLGSPTVGLGRFIKESFFAVPSHQRDFSWTEEYVREYIRDIEEAFAKRLENYFCGLMVFTSGSPVNFKVLDGQQRLATTLMLFSAVRNWLSGFTQFVELRVQVEEYLCAKELGAQQRKSRLILTAANNEAFQSYVIDSVPLSEMEKAIRSKSMSERSTTLVRAAIQINQHIAVKASSFDNPEKANEYFVGILKYLSDQVQIVRFVLSSDSAAYTIFETLNDRGLELAPLDLVKNYLFSHAEKFREGSLVEFEGRWAEMMALLSSAKADAFLRAFWSSRHGKPEGAKLFTAFKKAYAEPSVLHALSVDMRRDAERYAALFSSNDATWAGYSISARRSVDALGIIGFSQAHSIILSALQTFEKREMERLLWLIECVAVRHQLIGRRRPGRVESLGGRAAKEIFEKKIKSATAVLAIIKELYVPDDEFRLAFESHDEGSSKKIRYLVTGIERETVARNNETLNDELTPHSVTVEHIFPKSERGSWKESVREDPDWDSHFIYRLGNVCLLPGINHALGDKPLEEKTEVYQKSRLLTTNALGSLEQWGRQEIVDRQKKMAAFAIAAWRFQ